jgi:hypothetical protein
MAASRLRDGVAIISSWGILRMCVYTCVCVYACMCVCACIIADVLKECLTACMYACTYECKYVGIYVGMCMHGCRHTCMYMYAHSWNTLPTCTSLHICMNVSTYVCVFDVACMCVSDIELGVHIILGLESDMYTYMHTSIHTFIHTYKFICVCMHSCDVCIQMKMYA